MEPSVDQIEEDKLTLFVDWLLANWLQVILAVIIALGAGTIMYKRKVDAVEKEETAAEDLLGAISPEFQVDGMKTNQPVAVLLNEVGENHPGTKAAKNAKFLLASELYAQHKFTEAGNLFRDYLGLSANGPLAAAAQFGLAASQEASGSSKEAKVNYELVISLHGTAPEALQARVALAKMILAQSNPDTGKAKELLLAASQESQAGRIPGFWGSEAERMLAPLLVQAKKEVVPDKGPIEDTKKDK